MMDSKYAKMLCRNFGGEEVWGDPSTQHSIDQKQLLHKILKKVPISQPQSRDVSPAKQPRRVSQSFAYLEQYRIKGYKASDCSLPQKQNRNSNNQVLKEIAVKQTGISLLVKRSRKPLKSIKNQSKDRDRDKTLASTLSHLNASAFIFKSVIGRGAFGKVWLVQSKFDQKQYALKQISKALLLAKRSVESALNQRSLLQNLKNPFIVNMVSAFQDRKKLFLLMELAESGDLRSFMNIHRFSEDQTKFLVACLIQGLEHIHKNQIIHRDIKPQNLVIERTGYLKITDFGVARMMKSQNSGETSGTPGYMAPEVMCRLNHSFVADFYAVGVLIYQIMIGKRPYSGRSRAQIRDQILAKQAKINKKQLPAGWSYQSKNFVNKLLQRRPVFRLGFSGVHELKSHSWFKDFSWEKLQKREMTGIFLACKKQEIKESTMNNCQRDLVSQSKLLLRRDSVQALFQSYDYN